MSREWFHDYFDDLYISSHGLGLGRAPAEVDFMVSVLALPPGSAILDLACGHGRHAVELAKRGFNVAGLDLSRTLLAKAAELARNAGVNVELIEEDMRRIPETWAARFDAVVNVFTAWGYFDADAENEKVIEAVARSLKLGGRFLLDTINRDWLIRNFRERSWREGEGGVLTVEAARLDLSKSRSETQMTIILPDGRRVVRRVSVRLFTLAEVTAMFERHGLVVQETYGGWSGEEYSMDSRRMIVLAGRER